MRGKDWFFVSVGVLSVLAFSIIANWAVYTTVIDRRIEAKASPPADWRPRPEVVVEPYGSKNGTPEPPLGTPIWGAKGVNMPTDPPWPPTPSPTPIAWTEAEKRIIEAVQKLDAVNAAQNEAIGMLIRAGTTSQPGVTFMGEEGVIDLGTSNTLHAGANGGFELKARKR